MKKKKISEKEKSEERLKDLQKTLERLDKKLAGSESYFKKELPKKRVAKLDTLQKDVARYKKELAGNVNYIKRNIPKQKLISPSELKELIEERKTVLREIIGLKREIEKLEKERIRLESEEFKIMSDQHTERLKEYEDAVREELIGISEMFLPKKPIQISRIKRIRKKPSRIKVRKRPVPNKILQSYLNKINTELEEIKAKGKK
jgi:hypothetical protein